MSKILNKTAQMDDKEKSGVFLEEIQESGVNPRKRVVIETKKTTTTTTTTRKEIFVDASICTSDIQALLEQTDIDAIRPIENNHASEKSITQFQQNEEIQPLFSSTRFSEFEHPPEEIKLAPSYTIGRHKEDRNELTRISAKQEEPNREPRKLRSFLKNTNGNKSNKSSGVQPNKRRPKEKAPATIARMAKKNTRKSAIDDMIDTYASMIKPHHNTSVTNQSKRIKTPSHQAPLQLSHELSAIFENPDESMEFDAYSEKCPLKQAELQHRFSDELMDDVEHLMNIESSGETQKHSSGKVCNPLKSASSGQWSATATGEKSVTETITSRRNEPSPTTTIEKSKRNGSKRDTTNRKESKMTPTKSAMLEKLDTECDTSAAIAYNENMPISGTSWESSNDLADGVKTPTRQKQKWQRSYNLDRKSIKIYSPSCRTKFKSVNGNHVKITKEAIERAICKSSRTSKKLLKRYHAHDVKAKDGSRVVIIPGQEIKAMSKEELANMDPLALGRQRTRAESFLVRVD